MELIIVFYLFINQSINGHDRLLRCDEHFELTVVCPTERQEAGHRLRPASPARFLSRELFHELVCSRWNPGDPLPPGPLLPPWFVAAPARFPYGHASAAAESRTSLR